MLALVSVALTTAAVYPAAPSAPGSPNAPPNTCSAALSALLSGEYETAESLWQQEVDRLTKAGRRDEDYILALYQLGYTQLVRQRYVEAERSLRTALTLCTGVRGSAALARDTSKLLAQALSNLGRYREAEQLLGEWWAAHHVRPGVGNDLELLLSDLALLYLDAGRFEDAERCARRKVELVKTIPNYPQRQLLIAIRVLGRVYLAAGKLDEAKRAIDEAWTDPWLHDVLLTDLGWYHLRRGDIDEAIKSFEAAATAMTKEKNSSPLPLAKVKEGLGVALSRRGDADRSKGLLTGVLDVYEKHLGPDHPRVGEVLNTLARLSPTAGQTHVTRTAKIRAMSKEQEPRGLTAVFGSLP